MRITTSIIELLAFILTLSCGSAELSKKGSKLEQPIPVETQTLPAQYFPELDSQRLKVNYGANTVPPMHEDNGMLGVQAHVPLPCSDCVITWMQAGLEYADGSRADAATGMWLHHTVFSTLTKPNGLCPGQRQGDWFFASGNERTPVDLCESGHTKQGYYFAHDDVLIMSAELMNMLDHSQAVSLTVTWESIPSPPNPDSDHAFTYLTPYWLDIGGCADSEKPAKCHSDFHYSMSPKPATIPGQIKWVGGHLHDGGTHIDVSRNGDIICSMEAGYDTYGSEDQQKQHISSISHRTNIGPIEPGDKWSLTAHYDTTLHEPMATYDGDLEPIMGIAIVYVAENNSKVDFPDSPPYRPRHTAITVCIGITAVVAIAVIGHLWLKRRGETYTDYIYIPSNIRRSRWIQLGRSNHKGWFGGAADDTALMAEEEGPAYRDDE